MQMCIRDSPISLDGKGGYVTGLQNKDWDITNPTVVSGRAATEDQLKKVSDGFNNTVKLADVYKRQAHSGVSRSRVAIGKEVLALKKTVAEQNAQIQKLTTLLNGVAGTKMKADHTTLFPDIPTNHWAYEAVSDLSRRGLVEGYPDGTFGGDRMLTRYEFAQIVYRAIQDGVTVNDRLVTEFSPEMALFLSLIHIS